MQKTQVKHEWSLLCSNAIVDRDSNNLSLLNVIEQVSLDVNLKEGQEWDEKAGDMFPLNMVIVTRLRKIISEEESAVGAMKIDFISPDNKMVSSFEQDFELGKGIDNIRMRFGIGGLKLGKSGIYNFVISLKDGSDEKFKKAYSLPLKVTLNVILAPKV